MQGFGPSAADPAADRMAQQGKPRRKRDVRQIRRAQEREARWQRNRLAVPYRTDGPRLTFGVGWFVLLIAAIFGDPIFVAVLVSVVAALAGLQTAHTWFPDVPSAKWWAAVGACAGGIGGFMGPVGVVVGIILAITVPVMHGVAFPVHRYPTGHVIGGVLRATLPVGLAASSMAALGRFEVGALLALVALVSAYEVGDYLVGSGSATAIEGPVSGVVSLASVVFILWTIVPDPFTQQGVVLFGVLTALCCPLGQVLASAMLPRGAGWAPALRRLDSYLLAAPLWLVLLHLTPVAEQI